MGDIYDSGSTCARCDRTSDFDLCDACMHEGWRTKGQLVRAHGEAGYAELLARGLIEEGKSTSGYNASWTFVRAVPARPADSGPTCS